MRKLFIFMLTLLCAVGAWAQLTPKSDVGDGNYYISCPPKNNSYATSTGVSDSRLGISSTTANDCVFTITQGTDGNEGKYTIKFGDKYVTYSATTETDCVRLVDEASATDANKWWVFVEDEGNASYVDIFPYAASIARGNASWNFSVTVNGNANTAIGLYRGTDNNSKWKLTPSTGNVDRDNLGIAIAVANASVGETVGCYPQSAIEAAQSVYNNSTYDSETYAAATTTLQNARILPERGKYYTITSAYSGFMSNQGVTKSVYVDGSILKWKTTNLTDPTMYWEIYNDGSKYVFKNYSTGTFISGYANSQYSVGETAAASAGFTWFDGGQCNISIAGGDIHANSHGGGTGDGDKVIQYGSGPDGASSWYIIEVDNPSYGIAKVTLANRLNDLKNGKQLGINPGQFTISGMASDAYLAARAAAESVLGGGSITASDYTNALTALNTAVASAAFTKNEMEVGKYYRIQSTTRGTYTDVERDNAKTGTSKMWNYAYNENDPGQIWKLEQDGENYYLVNVLSGLYPQYVNGGQTATTYLGAKNAEFKFTHDIYSEASSTAYPVHRIYFGGRQVNVETAGYVNYWTAENARHYIWTVDMSDAKILELAQAWAASQVENVGVVDKINVKQGVTQVISPNEFAAPEVVNAAIDALTEYTSAQNPTLEQAQAVWNNASIVKTYKTNAGDNGGLLSVEYTLKAKYGTIILPINYSKPTNVKLYSCNGADDSVLILEEYTGDTPKNTPFIIEYTEEESLPTAESPKKYQFIGYNNGAASEDKTAGWLTGVLSGESATVAAGNYVLSKYNGKLGFYKVGVGATVDCPKYKCYLSNLASARAFYFDDEDVETGINTVEIEEVVPADAAIYDLSGRRVQSAKSGLYIVNGKKIIK